MKKHSRTLLSIAVIGLTAALTTGPVVANAATGDTWQRIAGVDRFDTSLQVAKAAYPKGANKVYVVSGMNYPDALSAASTSDGPILLANPDDWHQAWSHLQQLQPQQVVVIGGESALPAGFNHVSDKPITRIAGVDRFDTSLQVAKAAYPKGANKVYVVSGMNYPDALSAASTSDGPILLANPANPEQTRQHLQQLSAKQAVLIGGETVLPSSFNQIADNVTRIAGVDRFDTSLQVAKAAYPKGANKVYVVSGMNYPDALSAATFNDGPILLARPGQADTWPIQQLGTPKTILIGGENTLPTKPHPHNIIHDPSGEFRAYDMRLQEDINFQLVNEHRVKIGLNPLKRRTRMDQFEQWMAERASKDLAKYRHLTDADIAQFEAETGIKLYGSENDFGENAYYSVSGVFSEHRRFGREAFDAWMGSPGHRANIENPNYEYFGVGFAVNESNDGALAVAYQLFR